MRVLPLTLIVAASLSWGLPPRPTVARAVKDAQLGGSCKEYSPRSEGSGTALFMNTRTKEVFSATENSVVIYLECRRPAKLAGYPKAVRVSQGWASYSSIGGAWRYQSWIDDESWLEGMPPLDSKTLALADDYAAYMPAPHDVSKVLRHEPAKGATHRWVNEDAVQIVYESEYEGGVGGTGDITIWRRDTQVSFTRDSMKSPWAVGTRLSGSKAIGTRPRAPGEVTTSIVEQAAQARAAKRLAELPQVEVPAFASARELQNFVYKVLVSEPPDRAEAYLRRLQAKLDEEQLKVMLSKQAGFKDTYCPNPLYDAKMHRFMNKTRSSFTRIAAADTGTQYKEGQKVATWKLGAVELGVVTGPALAKLKSYSGDLCDVGVTLTTGERVRLGDAIEVRFGDTWYEGTLADVKNGVITVNTGKFGEEQTQLDRLRLPGTAPVEPPPEAKPASPATTPTATSTPAVAAPQFQVGQRIEGQWRRGSTWYPGTISGVTGGTYSIAYDDGGKEDNVPPQHVRVSTAVRYEAGQRVEAQWNGGSTWYPATISAVTGGTYSLLYDDGGRANKVGPQYIRLPVK